MNTARLKVQVASKAVLAEHIAGIELVAIDGAALPPFSAGSHIDVHVGDGLVRQYSLCNDPRETNRYEIAVLRDPASRGGSAALHDAVKVGSVIEISTPKNHSPLAHEARFSLLLAGGIGVTPILCMAERLAATGAPFKMHYCTRSRSRTAFLDRIKQSSYSESVAFHFDDEDASQRVDLDALLALPADGAHLYVCGPTGFMESALSKAAASGWLPERVHYEFFASNVAPGADDQAFSVRLASSGRVVVIPKDKTVTQALSEAGVDVPTSCEQGVCGTCLTRVLEGIPDHKDLFMTTEEHARNDQFTPCCSRSKSPLLVLDI